MFIKYNGIITDSTKVTTFKLEEDSIYMFMTNDVDSMITSIDVSDSDEFYYIRDCHKDWDHKDIRYLKGMVADKVYELIWENLIQDKAYLDIDKFLPDFITKSVDELEKEYAKYASDSEED